MTSDRAPQKKKKKKKIKKTKNTKVKKPRRDTLPLFSKFVNRNKYYIGLKTIH